MIDDSLADVQQEKKRMSAKELNFYRAMDDKALVVHKEEDKVVLRVRFGIAGDESFKLDRNQAHLLKLYLEEHLK